MKHLLLSLACSALMMTSSQCAGAANSSKAEETIASVSTTIRDAKKPADLDDLIAKLNKLANPASPAAYSPQGQLEQQRLQATYRFVTGWQEYLAASVAGDSDRAKNSLENILHNQQLGDPVFMLRSKLLEIQVELDGFASPSIPAPTSLHNAPERNPDTILEAVKSVDDIPDALSQLDKLAGADPKANQGMDWTQLANLVEQYGNIKAGLPVSFNLDLVFTGSVVGPDLSRVKALYLLYILPRYFGTEKSDPPKPNEQLRDYLERLADSAAASENWLLLQKVINVRLRLSGLESPLNPNMPVTTFSGSQCFLAGLSQETSGQFELAVKSYEDSLKFTDLILPQKVVASRLAAIKAAHPDDYEKGVEDAILPPLSLFVQQMSPFGHIGQSAMFNPMNQPNLPGYIPPNGVISVTPISSVISISATVPAGNALPAH